MKTIGFGLVGCGIWGSIHASTYQASPLVDLVAVCDQNRDRARQFAEKYGFEFVTSEDISLKLKQMDLIIPF